MHNLLLTIVFFEFLCESITFCLVTFSHLGHFTKVNRCISGFLRIFNLTYKQLHPLPKCQVTTEQEQRKRRRKKAVKSSYLPGNKALSKASTNLSSTVLSDFFTIAFAISSKSFFNADPRRKAKMIGSMILSIIFRIKKNREIGQSNS